MERERKREKRVKREKERKYTERKRQKRKTEKIAKNEKDKKKCKDEIEKEVGGSKRCEYTLFSASWLMGWTFVFLKLDNLGV